ncbi:MAG: ABC transporter ATP-binding protein [Actinomycetota bacterium]
MDSAVSVQGVSKRFRLYHERNASMKERLLHPGRLTYEDLWALEHLDLEIPQGQTVGILGHNGSGKSTLLKCICGVLRPTTGQVAVRGALAGLLELGAGFQPELSGRDNIYLNGSMLGLSKRDVDAVFDEIVAFAELEQFIDNQVKFYSSGMYVRLGFAVAVNVDPDVLVVDEVLAVGDERFQRKCIDRIKRFQRDGRTIIFVTHSADQVRAICDRAVVLDHGTLVADGLPGDAVASFREHLLASGGPMLPGLFEEEVLEEGEAQAVAKLASPAIRAAVIKGASIEQPGRAENAPVISTEPLSVSIDYEIRQAMEKPAIVLELRRPTGWKILRTTSTIAGLDLDGSIGSGRVTFTTPWFPFRDGGFEVAVGIETSTGELIDWFDPVASFQVSNHSRSSGTVDLELSISHERGEPG